MNDVVYITGHKNPDTDSICSAISYAELKNKMGVNAIPIRLGEVSKETQFVLDYFGIEAPKLIETVKTQIADLDIDSVTPIAPETSLKTAWSMMTKNNVKSVPVVDDEDKLLGLASQSNLTACYMDIWDTNVIGKSGTTLESIVDTLSAKYLHPSEKNPKFTGKVVVAAMNPESAEEFIDKGDIVICGNREDAQNVALNCGASLIVVTGNHSVSDEILERAKDCNCSVIVTPYDTFTSARLIPQSIPVTHVMAKDDLVYFKTDDLIDDVREIMIQTRYRSYPVVDFEHKIVGSISRYHLISENKKKIILVDHNEKAQSVHGLEDAEILEIIDHHKIGGVETGSPIYFRNEPVGCTATIVASRFFENGIRPSRKIAGLLCAAIISDTLLFKSPTSTNTDKLTLERLASIANINPEKFAQEMFIAGSSLEGKTPSQILNQDFKPFTMGNVKVGVGQISTMDTEGFEKVRKDVIQLMEQTVSSEGYGLILLMVTDILKGGSELIAVGDYKDAVSRAFGVTLEGTSAYAPGVLSRKKQVIPPLTAAMTAQK